MKAYRVKEVFKTLQGEGMLAGVPAVFLRFSQCNLWSGLDEHRERDAERHGAECPKFCDTDFVNGQKMDAMDLARLVYSTWSSSKHLPLVVFTGGEPLLQLDRSLLDAIYDYFPEPPLLAVETNGTVEAKDGVLYMLDHVCVSPKVVPHKIKVRAGTELKVVFPAYDPLDYEDLAKGFEHQLVSPEADTFQIGQSRLNPTVELEAAQFCLENPAWRLSLQQHKVLGLP